MGKIEYTLWLHNGPYCYYYFMLRWSLHISMVKIYNNNKRLCYDQKQSSRMYLLHFGRFFNIFRHFSLFPTILAQITSRLKPVMLSKTGMQAGLLAVHRNSNVRFHKESWGRQYGLVWLTTKVDLRNGMSLNAKNARVGGEVGARMPRIYLATFGDRWNNAPSLAQGICIFSEVFFRTMLSLTSPGQNQVVGMPKFGRFRFADVTKSFARILLNKLPI